MFFVIIVSFLCGSGKKSMIFINVKLMGAINFIKTHFFWKKKVAFFQFKSG